MFYVSPYIGFNAIAPLRLSFFGSATSTGSTITIPANAPDKSVAILVDVARGAISTPSAVNPNSNWTAVIDDTSLSNHRICIWYRILDSDDEGDTVTGMNDTEEDKVMLVFQGNFGVVSAAAVDTAVEGTSGNPASQTCNAAGVTGPLVVIGVAYNIGGSVSFSTASPAFDATVTTSDVDLTVGYKVYNSVGADHTIDMNDIGDNILASFFLTAV